MTSRDITTLCGVVMRLAGIPLIIWGPTKEAFYIGIALLMSGEVGPVGRALMPRHEPPASVPPKSKPRSHR